ncbi:MAG TPA: hypothetical protein VHT97_06680 [Acidimicrobiales bacterium]|nr:hypothetical protein [Acidimicrobiales bacterium]
MSKRNVGIALAAAAMLLQLVVGTAGPSLADTTPPTVTFGFAPTSGPPGTKVVFTGSGCPHDATKTFDGLVFLTVPGGSAPVGTPVQFVSDASGNFTGTVDTTGLTPAQYTTFAACVNTSTGGPGSPFTVTVPIIPGSTYFPLSPARVLDTRDGTGTSGVINPLGAGGQVDVKVTGVGGVPATGVTAVALNVVATNATGPASFLTVWPTGQARPLASNLNFTLGVSVPNLVIAQVGTDGKVSLFNNLGSVNVAADVQGYFNDPSVVGSTYVPLAPARVLDTRVGTGSTQAQVGPGQTIELTVTGVGGVPASGVTAVALNVTATNVSGAESFLTVWPSGTSRPLASNLNFIAGQTVPNLVLARVGDSGKISIYNNVGTVDVVADTQGYFAAPVTATAPPGSNYIPESPVRILDSRDGTGVPGGAVGQLGIASTLDVQVTGLANVPANATAVALNVTAADSPGPDSYLTVYPTGTTRPLASNLNFVAGQTVANMVIAKIGTGGKVTLYNNLGSTVVIADVQGYFTPAS